jgi:hypothetical protein
MSRLLKECFLGKYTDPKHPTGWRMIEAASEEDFGLHVRGVDESDGHQWRWTGTLNPHAPHQITVSASATSGPACLVGRLQSSGAIEWADGSVWDRVPASNYAAEYVKIHNFHETLTRAMNQVVRESPLSPTSRLAELIAGLAACPSAAPTSEVASATAPSVGGRSSDALNAAAYALGALAHPPPKFVHFDHDREEQSVRRAPAPAVHTGHLPCGHSGWFGRPSSASCPHRPDRIWQVIFKELKLPKAAQTHEVCYEPLSRTVLVSQMSSSVLVRLHVGADGLIVDDQDTWQVRRGFARAASAATGRAPWVVDSGPMLTLTPSLPHILISSHPDTSHPQTLTPSHPHPIRI